MTAPAKRGRKFMPPGMRRSERIVVQVSPAELAELERAADWRGLAPYVREAALKTARDRGTP